MIRFPGGLDFASGKPGKFREIRKLTVNLKNKQREKYQSKGFCHYVAFDRVEKTHHPIQKPKLSEIFQGFTEFFSIQNLVFTL